MGAARQIAAVVTIIVGLAGASLANWTDSFSDGKSDLGTWKFLCMPQVTGTFMQSYPAGPDGNTYLAFEETTPKALGGALFGVGFGSPEEFADVRLGAVVNVTGDASHNFHGLGARASYFIDPDGSLSGLAPGVVASCYVLHVNWEDGPANLRIDIEKVVNLSNIMRTNFDVVVPGLANERSYYAELDVVGAGPVYVTGSLYEFKGGPLVARTATMVDTAGNDPWENPDELDAPFLKGISGIFAQNEQLHADDSPGFHTTFDDVFSVSDGPAAVAVTPAHGAMDVSIATDLRWIEAEYAAGRQLWFGPIGAMQQVDPAPADGMYDPGLLDLDQIYEWRVDQIGPQGIMTGHTWRFKTGWAIAVDDFESYDDSTAVAAAWPHNIAGYDYIYLETSQVFRGAKAMCFRYQNQVDPFITEATHTFASCQDWTVRNPCFLSLAFRGVKDNVPQPLYVRVADAAGKEATVTHPVDYAVQTEYWRVWDIFLGEFTGVDLTAVAKLTIGTGSGANSGQAEGDEDMLYIDCICLSAVQPPQRE